MQVSTVATALTSDHPPTLRRAIYSYLLSEVVPRRGTLLDLGAGPCIFARIARDAGYSVTAVDGRTERVPPQKELGSIRFVQADVRKFDVSGDVVSMLGLFYHLTCPDQEDLLRRCSYAPTVILETQVHDPAVVPPDAKPWGNRLVRQGDYEGVRYPEGANPMASIGNPTSFWHTEESLVRMIANCGYGGVRTVLPRYTSKYGVRRFYVLEKTPSAPGEPPDHRVELESAAVEEVAPAMAVAASKPSRPGEDEGKAHPKIESSRPEFAQARPGLPAMRSRTRQLSRRLAKLRELQNARSWSATRVGTLVTQLRQKQRGLPPPPHFLVIGAQKAGTRWLRLNLGEHPDVFTPDFEPNYFHPGKPFEEDLDSYRARFEGWNGEPITGEATPHYMVWGRQYPHFEGPDVPPGGRPAVVASMIEQQLPDVRLFAVLRDPCERAYSAFLHHIKQGRVDPNADLLEYLRSHPPGKDPLGLISVGWYAASLAPYLERFGDQLSVFLNEDISEQPLTVYRQALDHIGADRSFTPPELGKVRFSTELPEESRHRLADGRHRGLTAQERAFLLDHFTADIDRLEKMLGRDLSGWRSPG